MKHGKIPLWRGTFHIRGFISIIVPLTFGPIDESLAGLLIYFKSNGCAISLPRGGSTQLPEIKQD
jgi:hypothetical protein